MIKMTNVTMINDVKDNDWDNNGNDKYNDKDKNSDWQM
jgi:hypothetical protein